MSKQQFEEYYCLNCGTAQKGNTTVGEIAKDRVLTCSDCQIVVRFYIMSPPKKTVTEAAKSFEDTPLTDHQRGHKIRKQRQRKRKTKK